MLKLANLLFCDVTVHLIVPCLVIHVQYVLPTHCLFIFRQLFADMPNLTFIYWADFSGRRVASTITC